MKHQHIFFVAALLLAGFAAQAQQKNTTTKAPQKSTTASVQQRNITDSLIRDLKRDLICSDSLTRDIIYGIYRNIDKPRYKMYPTENVYISLRLDTRTGKVDMVQYRTKDTKAGIFSLNYIGVVWEESGWDGRFELYPTQNMYTFFMIDTGTGNVYQVQWSTDYDHRFVERIYE